jgi:hypothetical protein
LTINPAPSLSSMKHVHIRIVIATLFLHISVDVAGPGNLVDLVLTGVKAAAARWPAVVTVTDH